MAHLSYLSIYLFVCLFFNIINQLFLFTITYLFVYYLAIYLFIIIILSFFEKIFIHLSYLII